MQSTKIKSEFRYGWNDKKTATSNNGIYCDAMANPPLCTIIMTACGPRTYESLFTQFSGEHRLLFLFLQEAVFSANRIVYNYRLYMIIPVITFLHVSSLLLYLNFQNVLNVVFLCLLYSHWLTISQS
jgi:hypothetical protein